MAFIAANIKHIFVLKPLCLHQLHPWILLEGLPNLLQSTTPCHNMNATTSPLQGLEEETDAKT